jgi:hypothetical protein
MCTLGEGRSQVVRLFMSNMTSSLGVPAFRNWPPHVSHRLEQGKNTYPPIKKKDFIVASLDPLQDLLNLVKIFGLDRLPVLEMREAQGCRICLDLEAVIVQRKLGFPAADVFERLFPRLEFEIGTPRVFGIRVYWNKELERFFLAVKW